MKKNVQKKYGSIKRMGEKKKERNRNDEKNDQDNGRNKKTD